MGAAKRRGTREQRVAQSMERRRVEAKAWRVREEERRAADPARARRAAGKLPVALVASAIASSIIRSR